MIDARFNLGMTPRQVFLLYTLISERPEFFLFVVDLFGVALLSRRLGWLVAATGVFLGYSVTVEGRYFEVDSTEFDDVSHAH